MDKLAIAQYRKDNPECELYEFPLPPDRKCRRAAEINHIFSVRKRIDLMSNIIHLSAESHRWFHEHPVDGRILCLLVKSRKGELDDDEIRKVCGMYPAGWLEKSKPTLDWMRPYYEELEARLDSAEYLEGDVDF